MPWSGWRSASPRSSCDPIFSIALSTNPDSPRYSNTTPSGWRPAASPPAPTPRSSSLRQLAGSRSLQLIASVARAGLGADLYDAHMSNSIIVLADKAGGGITDYPHTLTIERD